ncbi:hypothetical protein OG349_13570 [Streptomyces sp. NBC_01317]|uniref:hypothetical protein n=1 Tax=Streptomyces sp. NBC_01317 TaxID=2903822 RepID=UPI002E0EBACC|nr:hypothetical protein OG349_13570 [Streptomyces sp. NBC_01317]
MADGRDQWLDKDVAERLLRGERVEAVDGLDGVRAKRLSDTLRDMADVTYANDAELPGEAAALAAFRRAAAARAGRADAAAPSVGPPGPRAGSRPGPGRPSGPVPALGAETSPGAEACLGSAAVQDLPGPTVRLAPASGPVRAARYGGPLRMSLVATLAACALGGMALVDGGGVPHAGPGSGQYWDQAEAEAESAESPHPLTSGRPDGAGTMGGGSGPATPDASKSPGAATAEAEGESTHSGDGADEPIGPVGKHHDWSAGAPPVKGSTWYSRTVAACLAYRDGEIDQARKEELDRAAKNPAQARRFCDWLLDVKATRDGGGGTGTGGGKSGNGTGGGGGNGGGAGNGSGGGPVDGTPGEPTVQPYEPHIPPHPPTLSPGPPTPPSEPPATPADPPAGPTPTPTPTPSETPDPSEQL